jgi:hypothetical protein
VNLEANPAILKPTPVGRLAREGNDLARPITEAAVLRNPDDENLVASKNVLKKRGAPTRAKSYDWEKPEWTSGCGRLRATRRGEVVKAGGSVALPITQWERNQSADCGFEHKIYEWEKPSWTNVKLDSTGNGEAIKSGKSLAKPTTFRMDKGTTARAG